MGLSTSRRDSAVMNIEGSTIVDGAKLNGVSHVTRKEESCFWFAWSAGRHRPNPSTEALRPDRVWPSHSPTATSRGSGQQGSDSHRRSGVSPWSWLSVPSSARPRPRPARCH